MKQHPFYLGFSILAAAYLALSNARGWSLFHTINPARLFGGGPSSGFSHK